MISAMEMHDSILSSIIFHEGNALLKFDAAYIHKCSTDPESKSGTGWAQVAVLKIENCKIVENLPALPCELSTGSVEVDGRRTSNVFVLPFEAGGELIVKLAFVTGDKALMTGTHLSLSVIGEPEFIENVSFNVYSQLARKSM